MFPYHLFSYQPNKSTRIYALTYKRDIVYVRVMDYRNRRHLDNPGGVKFAMALAVLDLKIQNGLLPIANFAAVDNYPSVMPFFRVIETPALVHKQGMIYQPYTMGVFILLANLYAALLSPKNRYSPNGKLAEILHRCDSKTRGIEFLIRIEYLQFNRVDGILPIQERNIFIQELIK